MSVKHRVTTRTMAATIVSSAGLRLHARAKSSGAASSRVVARCESLPSQIHPPPRTHLVLPLAPHATRDAPDADASGPRLPSDLRGVTLRTRHVAPARLSRASLVTRAVATPAPVTVPEPEQRVAISAPRPDVAMPNMQDPWNDPKWKDTKWTVYRDVAYDLQPFYDKHPGGVGIARRAAPVFLDLMRLALERVEACDCGEEAEDELIEPPAAPWASVSTAWRMV